MLFKAAVATLSLMLILAATLGTSFLWGAPTPRISVESAERCALKLQSLENFSAGSDTGAKQTTRFSEEEINSYLAFSLSDSYHPSLQRLALSFQEDRMTVVASIDFDRLGETTTGMMPRLLNLIFTGKRTLTADGQLISGQGKAHFNLEQARFDERTIPNYLVNEIIASVGKTQKPPFDPTKPSELPYGIDRVALHPGLLIVYQ